ncbi:MAG: bifunctional phosphoglucose/phosphomannose isomerase [Chitinophagales bacterium]
MCRLNLFSMLNLIREFPAQILKALVIGEEANILNTFNKPIKNVVVAGLGGSGIGGDLLAELLRDSLQVPVTVSKGYFLPAFVDDSTLLILASYSGNTEEVISCATEAVQKGIKPVCVTSGGKLARLAYDNKFDVIHIPDGMPPRACLGYSSIQLFFILHHYGLISDSFKASFRKVAQFLVDEQEAIIEDSEFLAGKLEEKVIIIYAEDKYESVALRLKQQLNENSKMFSWYNVIPEMNHNEIVGWKQQHGNLAVLILRSSDEFPRNTERILFKKDVVSKYSENVFEIQAKGSDSFEKHFYLIHFGDWLSYHLAILHGYDPQEVYVIDRLKNHLNSVKQAD